MAIAQIGALQNQRIITASFNCNRLQIPIRSQSFMTEIAHRRFDIICITESGLNSFTTQQIINAMAPRNYLVIHRPRPATAANPRGGGICVSYRNNLQVTMNTTGYQTNFDLLEFTATSNFGRNTVISVVYILHTFAIHTLQQTSIIT